MNKMKKIVCLVLAVCILAVPSLCFADNGDSPQTYSAYGYLEDFINNCENRVAGSDGEAAAALYIKNKFDEMGYSVTLQGFSFSGSGVMKTSQNVVAELVSENSFGQIIIGAHYDNVSLGEGANDNGSGVAALLDLAKRLSSAELNYDVIFIAFGAEEEGFYGSLHYVEYMTAVEKQNTLLMLNIDSVAVGDNLYFFGEDIKTTLNDSLVNLANSLGYGQNTYAMPYTKDLNTVYCYGGIPYHHTGYAGDSVAFRIAGIPTEFVFSGTFSNLLAYTQSEDENFRNMHTTNDTLTSAAAFGEKAKKNMQIVSDTIFNALTNAEFEDIIINARANLVNGIFWQSWPAYVIYAAILAAFITFGILYLRKLKKRDLLTDKQVNGRKVFEAPDAQDIYDFMKK